jgi:hypothetical protein
VSRHVDACGACARHDVAKQTGAAARIRVKIQIRIQIRTFHLTLSESDYSACNDGLP